MTMWRRWIEYRRFQRDRLDQLRHSHLGSVDPSADACDLGEEEGGLGEDEPDLISAVIGVGPAEHGERTPPPAAASPGRGYGSAGHPINRQSPFYVGFVGALGVLTAYTVFKSLDKLGTTITLLLVALFLTLALNPLVEALTRRRVSRGWAVVLVFLGVLGVVTLMGFVVIPPVVQQSTELADNAPTMLDNLLKTPWVQEVDHRYELIQRVQQEITKRAAEGSLWSGIFDGVLGAGRIIASGVFSVLTVLVLTLYFLASLPTVKQAAYAMVPASRRPRVISLAEEIMRRVGSYAIGQVTVATINACCAWVMMHLLGIPFAAVLAVAVGFLGLIPMVGATLGASIVALVAFFEEPQKALIVIVYFIVYQQLENYAVMPRVMQRTVAVPGAVTIVAALAGGTLLGILGALLAIPVAAGLLLIYDEVLVPRQRRH